MATILITGAQSGLGLALAKVYTQRGDKVIALCLQKSPELEEARTEMFDGIDIRDDADVSVAAKQIGQRSVDVLINNAGILIDDDIGSLQLVNLREQFEVNALGPLKIALAFRECLRKGSFLINVSSRMGSIADNRSGGDYGYRMSKAAQNMLTSNLARDLLRDGVTVVAIHPGIVATKMTGHSGALPNEVADDMKNVIGKLTISDSGKFLDRYGAEIPW
ncbi:MAG: SDR family oxidoreductase [Pseudomonadota bacterium]|nr:SDR family oxidoreductase [Pseudomonadota bacterium]